MGSAHLSALVRRCLAPLTSLLLPSYKHKPDEMGTVLTVCSSRTHVPFLLTLWDLSTSQYVLAQHLHLFCYPGSFCVSVLLSASLPSSHTGTIAVSSRSHRFGRVRSRQSTHFNRVCRRDHLSCAVRNSAGRGTFLGLYDICTLALAPLLLRFCFSSAASLGLSGLCFRRDVCGVLSADPPA